VFEQGRGFHFCQRLNAKLLKNTETTGG
jgi:hypothetical protein